MIKIVVLIKIKDKIPFKEFEKKAISIMKKHNGQLLTAFTADKAESTIQDVDEVHELQFENLEAFKQYRLDPELQKLSALRNQGILTTTIIVSGKNDCMTYYV
jgi:uncharacterized protein (DUF1330 family)